MFEPMLLMLSLSLQLLKITFLIYIVLFPPPCSWLCHSSNLYLCSYCKGVQHGDLPEALSVAVLITLILLSIQFFFLGRVNMSFHCIVKWLITNSNENPIPVINFNVNFDNYEIVIRNSDSAQMVQETPIALGKWPWWYLCPLGGGV